MDLYSVLMAVFAVTGIFFNVLIIFSIDDVLRAFDIVHNKLGELYNEVINLLSDDER